MESTKIITSLLLLALTCPTLSYPFTRGSTTRSRARTQALEDYLGAYQAQAPQYGLPEYRPNLPQQRPKITAETLAAILPYLNQEGTDYNTNYDYNNYNDDDGTWYDDSISAPSSVKSEDASLVQLLLDHLADKYSLEDLETLEREAALEDNTENQLHALMAKKINKKSSALPLIGARNGFRKGGQKEEALLVPATSVRRPVYAKVSHTQSQDDTESGSSSLALEAQNKREVSNTAAVTTSNNNNSSAHSVLTPDMLAGPQRVQHAYENLKKYIDRERQARQAKDLLSDDDQEAEENIREDSRRPPQKRFITEQDALTQQLANLKKAVA